MEVKSIISPSVKAVRVIELQKGNVYKRINKKYSDSYETRYGVVLEVLNGDKTFIDVVEVEKSYGDATFEFKVIGDGDDLNMYPTTKDELLEYFGGVEDSIKKGIAEAKESLAKKEKSYKMFQAIAADSFGKITDTKFEKIQA